MSDDILLAAPPGLLGVKPKPTAAIASTSSLSCVSVRFALGAVESPQPPMPNETHPTSAAVRSLLVLMYPGLRGLAGNRSCTAYTGDEQSFCEETHVKRLCVRKLTNAARRETGGGRLKRKRRDREIAPLFVA